MNVEFEFAHESGASSVEENTTLDALVGSAMASASSAASSSSDALASAANPGISRYVIAPISSVSSRAGSFSSQPWFGQDLRSRRR